TGLVIETGEAREVHHMCVLAGYGAEAINPWLAFDTIDALAGDPDRAEAAKEKYVKALGKGILKVMSKMGISTYQSYCGAQIFDSIGLSSSLVERFFTGTSASIDGIDLPEIADETARRHRSAFGGESALLDSGGIWAQRVSGEAHAW